MQVSLIMRLLALALAVGAPAEAAPKTDTIVFANGDHLTGEVKGLDRGKLRFDTDATGTISIEWNRLRSLESGQWLQVELASGARHFGKSVPALGSGMLRIEPLTGAPQEFEFSRVVRIDPIDQGSFFARIDGYLTAGYDYTKANNLQILTLTGGITLRNERSERSLDASTTLTMQDTVEDSGRFDTVANYRRFMADRWFYQGFLAFEGNDELGLELRSSLGAGFGRYLVQNSKQEWSVIVGLAANRENFEAEDSNSSLEAIAGTQYSFFRFNDPEANLDAGLYVLPSLTESGRVRAEAKLRSRFEIVQDLFFELSFYGSYDTDADVTAKSNSDYGMTTSLGYSF